MSTRVVNKARPLWFVIESAGEARPNRRGMKSYMNTSDTYLCRESRYNVERVAPPIPKSDLPGLYCTCI